MDESDIHKAKIPLRGCVFRPYSPVQGAFKEQARCYPICPSFGDCGAFVEKFIRAYSRFGNVVLTLGNSGKQEFAHDSFVYTNGCSAGNAERIAVFLYED